MFLVWARSTAERNNAPAIGAEPVIPDAKAQGLPTLKMPTAQGWGEGHAPTAAPGLSVNAFASNLEHPRWIYLMPTDDVLVEESKEKPWDIKAPFQFAMHSTR